MNIANSDIKDLTIYKSNEYQIWKDKLLIAIKNNKIKEWNVWVFLDKKNKKIDEELLLDNGQKIHIVYNKGDDVFNIKNSLWKNYLEINLLPIRAREECQCTTVYTSLSDALLILKSSGLKEIDKVELMKLSYNRLNIGGKLERDKFSYTFLTRFQFKQWIHLLIFVMYVVIVCFLLRLRFQNLYEGNFRLNKTEKYLGTIFIFSILIDILIIDVYFVEIYKKLIGI